VSVEPSNDRSEGADRVAPEIQHEQDRWARVRNIAATLIAFCGGLALLFLFFSLLGAVDFGDSIVFVIVAAVLALVWLLGAVQRARSGAGFVTRADRERRGF